MPAPWDTSCLYSTVRNVSGQRMNFPWLPPHGAYLDHEEEVLVFGNILEAVNRGDRFGRRFMNSLEGAVANGYVEIVNTPSPLFKDLDDDSIKMLVVDDGDVLSADPCWADSV